MLPAHTWGDIVVYLPQHKILFAGDVAFFYVAPFCQNAHPSRWIEWCQTIERMDVTTIVPGHGPIGGKEQLAAMRGAVNGLMSDVLEGHLRESFGHADCVEPGPDDPAHLRAHAAIDEIAALVRSYLR